MDALLQVTAAGADLAISGGDLAVDLGLETAVWASLFVDRRAEDGQVGEGVDPRGYWGESDGAPWGSQLWLIERAKRTKETSEFARRAALEGLAWMVSEGIASLVEVEAEYSPAGVLLLTVILFRSTDRRWAAVWNAVADAEFPSPGTVVKVFFR